MGNPRDTPNVGLLDMDRYPQALRQVSYKLLILVGFASPQAVIEVADGGHRA